jgi:hypothetical protein
MNKELSCYLEVPCGTNAALFLTALIHYIRAALKKKMPKIIESLKTVLKNFWHSSYPPAKIPGEEIRRCKRMNL